MGLGSLFKLPQYNVFDYKPRFYSPEEERRRELLNDLRNSKGKDSYGVEGESSRPGMSIKGSFRPKMPRRSYSTRNSSIRVIAIAITLALLAYLILVADLTPFVKIFAR